MTSQLSPRSLRHRGLTIVEITIVITLLLLLISILFVGSIAWKKGGDRAGCLLTLRNTQLATRSYQNLYGYRSGARPYTENGTRDIAQHLLKRGYIASHLFHEIQGSAPCPSGGYYSRHEPDTFPPQGELYIECSLASSEDHKPDYHEDW
jgi:hypothetical protein